MRLVLPSSLSHSGFTIKIVYTFLIYLLIAQYTVHFIILDSVTLITFGEEEN
jgi:hypothetical protein